MTLDHTTAHTPQPPEEAHLMTSTSATIQMSTEGMADLRRWAEEVSATAPIPVSLMVAPDVLEAVLVMRWAPPPPYAGTPMMVNRRLQPGDVWAVYPDGSMADLRTGALLLEGLQ